MDKYTHNALKVSKLTTEHYSTSFSIGVRMLGRKFRMPVYAIYGFVRVADEIVDTFHGHDQSTMLESFRQRTFQAIEEKISTNPILHSFQWAVNRYLIDHELIHAFLDSMAMDLTLKEHDEGSFKKYVYGSAEVVGLMCLRVFYPCDNDSFEQLKQPARKLGEAFQKINFLRDISEDYKERGRFYFPGIDMEKIDENTKTQIEADISRDFKEAREGIRMLNRPSRLGVLISYAYYLKLFKKIRKTSPDQLFAKRYRIHNARKMLLLGRIWISYHLRLV